MIKWKWKKNIQKSFDTLFDQASVDACGKISKPDLVMPMIYVIILDGMNK